MNIREINTVGRFVDFSSGEHIRSGLIELKALWEQGYSAHISWDGDRYMSPWVSYDGPDSGFEIKRNWSLLRSEDMHLTEEGAVIALQKTEIINPKLVNINANNWLHNLQHGTTFNEVPFISASLLRRVARKEAEKSAK